MRDSLKCFIILCVIRLILGCSCFRFSELENEKWSSHPRVTFPSIPGKTLNHILWKDNWKQIVLLGASNEGYRKVRNHGEGPYFCWLKGAKTLLRHYAKRALTPRSLNMKLGPRRNYHEGRAAIRHYANQPARPLWPLCRGPNFTLRDRGVNARSA